MKTKIKKINKSDVEVFITFGVVLLSMLLFAVFPYRGLFQEIMVSLIFLLVVPWLFVKFVLKKKWQDFGLRLPDRKDITGNLFIGGASFLIVIMLMYLISRHTSFGEQYYLAKSSLRENFVYFLLYEFLAVNFFVFLYEFFFRGFVMFYFAKRIGAYAIIFQFLIFLLFLDISNQLNLSSAYYMIIAPFAGLIAYRSNSLLYSYLFSIITVVVGDLVFIKLMTG